MRISRTRIAMVLLPTAYCGFYMLMPRAGACNLPFQQTPDGLNARAVRKLLL